MEPHPARRGGAATAGTPAEAAAGAELVITVLSDPAAVTEVLTAATPGLRDGTLVVEMSTVGPAAVAALRDLLPAGVGLVDAPVLGSVGPARDGALTVLAGGLPADLARCRKVLGVFGEVRELGGPGAGAAMKLAVMSVLVPAQVLLAEAVAYGRAAGVDAGALLDVLDATPLGALAERVRPAAEGGAVGRRYGLGLAAKDLALAVKDLAVKDPAVKDPAEDLSAGNPAPPRAGADARGGGGERLAGAVSSGWAGRI
nr:hypothetical protein GCM10020093_033050 [Planobispora longispora]